jgi:hypothetical protein
MLSPRIIADAVLADEIGADDKGFRQPVGLRLLGIGQVEPELRSITKQIAGNSAGPAASK